MAKKRRSKSATVKRKAQVEKQDGTAAAPAHAPPAPDPPDMAVPPARRPLPGWALPAVLILALTLGVFLTRRLLAGRPKNCSDRFPLLSQRVARMAVKEYLARQSPRFGSYRTMREQVSMVFGRAQGTFAFYFEDLQTGLWVGIREKEPFAGASLLKVPTVIAVLKKVEDGDLSLGTELELQKQDIDPRFGDLWRMGEGFSMSLEGLVQAALTRSDNTAVKVFNGMLSDDEQLAARYAVGLPCPTPNGPKVRVSPKQYANLFRALYCASYLKRPMSQWALSMLTTTDYNEGIPAGVPDRHQVAHKIGMWQKEGCYHDCGIVYTRHMDYLLCVMSRDATLRQSNRVSRDVSKLVYEFVMRSRPKQAAAPHARRMRSTSRAGANKRL